MARVFSEQDFADGASQSSARVITDLGTIGLSTPRAATRVFSEQDFADSVPTLSTKQNILGGARSILQGLTLGGADEVEGAVAGVESMLGGGNYGAGYDQGLFEARSSVKDFKQANPILGTLTEVGGSLATPGGIAKTFGGKILGAIGTGTVTGYLSGEEDRVQQANNSGVLSGIVQSLFGTVGKVAKPLVNKLGDFSEQFKLKSLGIDGMDVKKSVRSKMNTKLKLKEPEIIRQVTKAADDGLIEPGQSGLERILTLENAKNTKFENLTKIADEADTVGKKVWVTTQSDFPNAYKYLENFSPGSAEHKAVKDELTSRISGITKNIREAGTVKQILDEKRYLNNVGATSQFTPYVASLQTALRTDLKELSERKIASKLGSTARADEFTALNKEFGDLQTLQNTYSSKVSKDFAPEMITDKIIRSGATTGGAGVPILLGKEMPGISEMALAPLLAASRSEKGMSVIGEVFGGLSDVGGKVLNAGARARKYTPGLSSGSLTAQALDQDTVQPMDYNDNSSKNIIQEVFKNPTKQEATVVKPDETFLPRVKEISNDLGIDHKDLLKVMNFETGGSFDSAQKNKAGSGATGLIQFMPATAKGLLGTETGAEAISILEKMTPTEQLDLVQKHLEPYKNKIKNLDDLYMAVLYPKAVGKDSDYVLFREGTIAYKQNKGLDKDKDGIITKADAASKVRNIKV